MIEYQYRLARIKDVFHIVQFAQAPDNTWMFFVQPFNAQVGKHIYGVENNASYAEAHRNAEIYLKNNNGSLCGTLPWEKVD